jgi:molybdopterin/thiamine biosynthesis adenylyltransferase
MAGKPVPIEVHYPSEYPELPPLIVGPPGLMDRHQHRFGGSFCLLARPLDDWPAEKWGGADLIGERLTALIQDTEEGPAAIRAAEEPMPEPVSTYYRTANDAAVLIPENFEPTGEEHGTLIVRLVTPHLSLVVGTGDERLDEEIAALFPGVKELPVPWLRLAKAPPTGPDGAAVADWLRREHPDVLAQDLPPRLRNSSRLTPPPPLELCCLVFPEEGPEVGEFHDGYLFLHIHRDQAGHRREALVSAQRLSAGEHARRAPELSGLEDRQVLVVGLGTLGGDIAVELAKAGVGTLDLVDFDSLEFGNLLRHRLSLEYLGLPKVQGVATAARRANPFCAVTARHLQLGSVKWEDESPLSQLAEAVEEADIIVEASGSHQIAQVIGRLCAQSDTPMVSTWLTEGFFGGEVVRIHPGRTMCWTCFATAQREGSLLSAQSGPPSQVAALGCSHPTTAGAGFDALEAAAVATRLTVQTLAPSGGYPECDWDHAVLNFRGAPQDPKAPRFAVEVLAPQEDCEQCRASAGSALKR